MLAVRLRIFPNAALRTPVITSARDHVDEFVALYAVKPSDGRFIPAINAPLDGFEKNQW